MSEQHDEAIKSARKWLQYADYDLVSAERALLSPKNAEPTNDTDQV